MKKKLKKWIIKTILKFKNYKIEDAIIICSEARGGSTWLMELLRNIPGTIINWEPLHVTNGVVPSDYKLGWRPLLNRESQPKYESLFRKILELKLYNNWTLRFVDLVDIKPSAHVLTKFVRANNLLPYFIDSFPEMKYPPIFLLRHPITTCISRLKTFEKEKDIVNAKNRIKFVVPDCINNERFNDHVSYLDSLETTLEFEVAIWCVNNAHLVAHKNHSKWCTIYYEDMVLQPEQQLRELAVQLGLTIPEDRFKKINFRKASATNYQGDLKNNQKEQLENFLVDLDETQLVQIQAVFNHFNFKTYTAYSAYPIKTI